MGEFCYKTLRVCQKLQEFSIEFYMCYHCVSSTTKFTMIYTKYARGCIAYTIYPGASLVKFRQQFFINLVSVPLLTGTSKM